MKIIASIMALFGIASCTNAGNGKAELNDKKGPKGDCPWRADAAA